MANYKSEVCGDTPAFNEDALLEQIYVRATNTMNHSSSANAYKEAGKSFESIRGYKDSANLARLCFEKASKIKKRNKIFLIVAAVILFVAIVALVITVTHVVSEIKYNNAIALMNDGKYTEAISAFEALDGYKDSAQKISECQDIFADQIQEFVDNGDYSSLILHTRTLSEKDFVYLLSDLTFEPSRQSEFYHYLFQDDNITSIASFCNEVSKNEKYLNLISEYLDVKNVLALYEIFEKAYDYNYNYITLFKKHIQEITAVWDTKLIQNLLTSDDIISYYMNGKWTGKQDQSEYYLDFYHKSGTPVNLTTCNYNIPYPDVTFAYWDFQGLEFVFLDKKKNVVEKVYKIEFVDENTINVYSYENSKTYTLTRTFSN